MKLQDGDEEQERHKHVLYLSYPVPHPFHPVILILRPRLSWTIGLDYQ